MSKGLEELRRVKCYVGQVMIRDKEIANNKLLNCLCDFEKSCITIEKELKALEIIRKNIGLHRLSEEFDYLLNDDEYKLLKEVLL